MKLYADRPLRLLFQVLADALAVVWIFAWVRAGLALYDALNALAAPGRLMTDAGDGLTANMTDAAELVREVPLAGDSLAAPFTSVGEAGTSLSEAGTLFQQNVADLAMTLALLTTAVPVLLVLVTWLPARLRWARRAGGAARLRSLPEGSGDRLLALRALASVSPARLAAVHPDPVGAWQSGDPAVVRGLADLELRRSGLSARHR
ncbi:hypothetical protein [Nocardiopsis trehalosi]|uniref:hypothetical protein n=1 Tax=Nocardiopsis trehalosi TaxID=109329 RepID=UPI000831F602|nr:hypothetical protein [Nocardiopsis trehalosi]